MMPFQDEEVYKKLDALHSDLCRSLDVPGMGGEKIDRISSIISELRVNEPDAWWVERLTLIGNMIDRVLFLADQSEECAEYDAASMHLKDELQGYYNHICSIRPRKY